LAPYLALAFGMASPPGGGGCGSDLPDGGNSSEKPGQTGALLPPRTEGSPADTSESHRKSLRASGAVAEAVLVPQAGVECSGGAGHREGDQYSSTRDACKHTIIHDGSRPPPERASSTGSLHNASPLEGGLLDASGAGVGAPLPLYNPSASSASILPTSGSVDESKQPTEDGADTFGVTAGEIHVGGVESCAALRSPSPDIGGMEQLSVRKAGEGDGSESPVPSPSPSASVSGVPSPYASNLPSPAPPTPRSSGSHLQQAATTSPNKKPQQASASANGVPARSKPQDGVAVMPFPARASKDYLCVASCGAGSYGEVYKAIRRADGQVIALKVLEGDKWALEEASILRKLDHECICKLYDCFECPEDGVTCLVMEYASGGDLLERITNSGPLTEATAVDLCKQLLQALKHMHDKGVVHRDLKPENVLYSDDGKPLLADFGVGKRLRGSVPPEDAVESLIRVGQGGAPRGNPSLHHLRLSDDSVRTHTQQIGTVGYSAPEVNSEQGHSFAADIWSLGAMFYVLLCGYHPFDMGDDEPQVIQDRVRKGEVLATAHTCIHTRARSLSLSLSLSFSLSLPLSHARTHMYTYTHTPSLSLSLSLAHTYTRTHARTHTHTYTHTDSLSLSL